MRGSVVFLALLMLPLGVAGQGGDAPAASYTEEDFFHVTADGTELAATRYVPAGDGPFAAMLITNGWTNRHSTGNERWWSEHYAEQGYLVYGYTSRGWGESGGEIGLDGPNEVQDAREFVDRIAADPAALLDAPGDPRVGMVGASYGGGIQFLTAREEPRIDAIAPHITWSDLLESLIPEDVMKRGWVSLLLASGAAEGHGIPLGTDVASAEPDLDGPMLDLYLWYADATAANEPRDDLRAALGSVRSLHADELGTPTFLVQGWRDTLFPPSQALRTHALLHAAGVPVRLALADIGHGGFGTIDDAVQAHVDAWFNTTLRDAAPDLPPYPVLRHRYGHDDLVGEMQWPPAGTDAVRFYLDAPGEGGLVPAPPATATETLLAAPAVPASCTEVSQFQAQSSEYCPFGVPGTFARWTTAPLALDTEVTGTPTLRLTFQGEQTEGVMLFAQLLDVASDGTAQPVLHQVRALRDAVPSRHVREVDLETISHRFEAGHRIGLQVATTDLMFAWSRVPGTVTIHAGGDADGWIELPVVPDDRHGDRTPPIVRVRASEVPRPGHGLNLTVVAVDDLAVGSLRVTVEGQALEPQEIEGILHHYRIDLPVNLTEAQARLDSIQATATDLAGNTATATLATTAEEVPREVEDDPDEQDRKKSPAIGFVALFVLLAALAVARRRDRA